MRLKHKLKSLILIFLLVFIVGGCRENNDPESYGPLVVEGWIDSNGHPTVLLSRSIVPSGKEGEMSKLIVKWGVVTISDGEKEVILTGKSMEGYIPPYIYTTTSIFGKPGRTYTLKAVSDNQVVSATCTTPVSPVIDSITFKLVNEERHLMAATLYMTGPADAPSYYHLSTCQYDADDRLLPALFGTFCIEKENEKIQVPIFRGKQSSDNEKYVPNWECGSMMEVKVERVSREIYEFWQTYDNAQAFGNAQFIGSSQSLPTNIQNGYGYFSAQGAISCILLVLPN